jgi:hypothetical protein
VLKVEKRLLVKETTSEVLGEPSLARSRRGASSLVLA